MRTSRSTPAPLRIWIAIVLAIGSLGLMFFGWIIAGFFVMALVPFVHRRGRRPAPLPMFDPPQLDSDLPMPWLGDETDPRSPFAVDAAMRRDEELCRPFDT